MSPEATEPAVPPPTDRVRAEWLARVEAEYRSAAQTQELTLWLTQIGASPDLLHAGLRVAGDEVDHADLSFEAYLAAGGDGGPTLARETLGLVRSAGEPLEVDVLRTCLDGYCLGETVAVPLFQRLREGCTVPVARKVLDRVLADEVRHRDFGWATLGFLLELPLADTLRATATRELPSFFARLRRTYGANPGAGDIPAAERAWGLMSPAVYAEVLERTVERDWIRRFGEHGIDAAAAWAESARR